jgi:chromosome segregation ATPase
MPELNTRSRTTTGVAEPLSPVKENRVDPPHAMANGRETGSATVEPRGDSPVADAAEVEVASLAMVQQLRLQAQQLSHHLSQQQQDLDRREAEIQARAAQLEQQERSNRLWLKERHEELFEREAALKTREQELAECREQINELERRVAEQRRDNEHELQARRASLERREAAAREADVETRVRANNVEAAALALEDAGHVHEELVADLERRTNQFDARRSATFEMIERFLAGAPVLQARPKRATPGTEVSYATSRRLPSEDGERSPAGSRLRDEFDELADLLRKLEARRAHLSEAESLLAHAESEVAELRQSILNERQQLEVERQAERRRNEAQRQRVEAELMQRQETLEAASQQLELRRAAVEQMRAELTVAQRDALENRLAAEELVTQLAGAIPPAQLSHQVARSRARLTECYRLQQEGIVDERRQLEALAVQITEQHGRLAAQKRDLERWLSERTDEAEAETARLAEREKQLDRLRDRLEMQRYDWEHERQEYQHQIRRLLAELGR